MKKTQDKQKFGRGHFPAGTVCEVNVRGGKGKAPRIVTTTGLVENGLNSFCITTDEPDQTTGTFSCNIDHVIRIIKRGPGFAKITRRNEGSTRQYHRETTESRREIFQCIKPKSHYLTFDEHTLVYMVALDYINDDMLLDNDKLVEMIRARGLIKQIDAPEDSEFCLVAYTIPKQKLRQAIKQLINKCLRNRVKAEEEEQKAEYERYKREQDRDEFMYG